MQSTQHRNRVNPVRQLRWRSSMHWRVWNPLPKPLMRSGVIEGHRIRFEKPGELLLLEDQEVIQAFSPHAAQKTFTDRIREGAFDMASEGP